MASLTPTAYYARLAIKYGGMALIALMVGRFTWGRVVAYWEATHPKAPPPPDVAFGVLPNIRFPTKFQPAVSYSSEFPTGQVPTLIDRAAVYLVPAKKSPLLALDEAKVVAKSFGFEAEPIQRSEELYQFAKESPLPATVDMYIYWGVFILSTDWSKDPDFLTTKRLPTEEQAIDEVKSTLKKAGLLDTDLINGEVKITYLKAVNGVYRETVSLSEADFIQVDLYREGVTETTPGYTPDPRQGLVRAVVSGNPKMRIVQLEYYYYPIDSNTAGIYPLKSTEQAWAELQAGNGYIAQLDPDISSVVVRRLNLGYYESFQPQYYYQPIYVFRGDNNFVGYVEAVAPPTQLPTLTPEPPA
ncbi:hypothetical protein A2W24_03955 [Microgenomates group bacterium RBG_16_45_19]|nr:MAG: hypothetical protein A2W24_03955 [Microgenomates group bacterium RBG_16_45_19]